MGLTQEEKDGLRALFGQIRQIGEDFAHVYAARLVALRPRHGLLANPSVFDGGETLLSNIGASLCLLDELDRHAIAVTILGSWIKPDESMAGGFKLRFECFLWAIERCLGEAFTPELKTALHKLTQIAVQRTRPPLS